MKYNKIFLYIIALVSATPLTVEADSIPSAFSRPLTWQTGAEISFGGVPGSCEFLRGDNSEHRPVNKRFSADLRAGFSFSPSTREGILYKGLYQGIGIGVNSYFSPALLGTPFSVYAHQGAPIAHITNKLWIGYEWQFGATFGWKHDNTPEPENHSVTSTAVTAHMGISFKFNYDITDRFKLSLGVGANHFSNGNTSWPNAGVNSIGAILGFTYLINPQKPEIIENKELEIEADSHKWFYDIMAYGAWRKRIVRVGNPEEQQLCPGKFGVAGLQFSPLYCLNRWVSVGPALDMQWDESAGLEPYWISGSYWEHLKFRRPPFVKQLSIGTSAHAELTMPIFSVNVGLGYDILSPVGNKRFYQSLTLKTFVARNIFLNVGYRLGAFKDPQNLMLGVGIRL